ncbi:alpha/beta hydrolase [Phytomonospora sp. NPDC050363]|uniref:alpha/beta hydrolase family protein n=1 Tax=Phytomonospora sp. NPDC050363 TaxID=3155642 RepID=UPI0033E1FAFD
MELAIRARDADLPATLTLPEGPILGGLVPLHGSNCGQRDFRLYRHLAETLPPQGIAVLRYDRRPNGGHDVPFHVQADDAREAASLLRRHIGEAPIGSWGFSQGGGWVAPLAAATWPDEFAFVVNVSGSSVSPGEQMRYGLAEQLRKHGFGDRVGELAALQDLFYGYLRGKADLAALHARVDEVKDEPWWPLLGYPERVPAALPGELWPDLDFDIAPAYERLAAPVLCFYGETDEWTPIDDSVRVWAETRARGGHEPATVVRLPGCDHEPWVGDGVHPEYERVLGDWLAERVRG